MIRHLVLLAALLLAPFGAHAEALPFQVQLPPGFRTVTQQGPDFTVYYFNKGDQTYAGAYYGFAPQFEMQRSGDGRHPTSPVQQVVHCKAGVVESREILLVLHEKDMDWFVHAWTAAGADRVVAETILASIRVAGKNDGIRVGQLKPCAR